MTETVEVPQTVADLVIAREHDAHAGLRFEGRTWAWADIVEEAKRRAAILDAARTPGPFHIGVLLENVPEYLFLLSGAALARATIVGINPTRRGEELARDIRHTDCQLVLTDTTHRQLLEGLELGISDTRVVDVDSPDFESRLPSSASWQPTTPAAPEDLYLLLFTSGSSGAPKAVRMTQGRAVRAADSLLCSRDDVPYCAMPLFHGNALNACVLPALRVGAMIALRRKFSASEFIDDVRANGCTYFSSIGRVLNYVLATPERPDDADNPLKLVLGPESSAADMVEFKRRFNCPVFAGYGSSENAIILLPAPGSARGALGVAPEGDDVVVLDPATGEECPTALFDDAGKLVNGDEAIGELVGRNALERFEGYYNNADAGHDRTRNGWYWSGDLAYRDDVGIFWFAGRTADWIRVDGENFAAAPIERILARFSGVREAVVYGVPDERNAEDQVMACLELSDRVEFDPAAFTIFLDTQADLGTKWAPRFVRIAKSLPTTGTNKIDKKPLRSEAWNTDDPIWWRRDRRLPSYAAFTPSDAAGLSQALAENRRIHI